jgi:hypothetical protein
MPHTFSLWRGAWQATYDEVKATTRGMGLAQL